MPESNQEEDLFTVQDEYGTHTYDKSQRVFVAYCPRTGERVESVGAPAEVSAAGYQLEQRGFRETRVEFRPHEGGKKIRVGPNVKVSGAKIDHIRKIDRDLHQHVMHVDEKGSPRAIVAPAAAAPAPRPAPSADLAK